MRPVIRASLLSIAVALAVSGCKPAAEPASQADATSEPEVAATAAAVTWPASLNVMGDGFPDSGDACRRIGESEATVNFLDDSATLAGCLSADDAAKLGGTVVATVEGVTLVSVPDKAAMAGDGDGQGDAKVAGTNYNATAQIRCAAWCAEPRPAPMSKWRFPMASSARFSSTTTAASSRSPRPRPTAPRN